MAEENFIVRFNIGRNRTDSILVNVNDNPILLAEEFCKKHTLNVNVFEFICNSLTEKKLDFLKKLE